MRDVYDGRIKVDASGELPSGERFENSAEFRLLISERSDEFTRCLAEKLLTYALGRELEYGDREVIDAMVTNLEAEQGGLKDLVMAVVLSNSFGRN